MKLQKHSQLYETPTDFVGMMTFSKKNCFTERLGIQDADCYRYVGSYIPIINMLS